jgi:hypothetical protein
VVGGSVVGRVGCLGYLSGLGVDEMSEYRVLSAVVLISDLFTTRQSLHYRLEKLSRTQNDMRRQRNDIMDEPHQGLHIDIMTT